MQDKIVIYNEIVDTLRAIMNIFRYYKVVHKINKKSKKASPRGKKVHDEFGIVKLEKEGEKALNPLTLTSNKFDLLEELQTQNEEDEDEEGYTIDNGLILQAWKRFRPVNKQDSTPDEPKTPPVRGKQAKESLPRTKQRDIE